MKKTLSVIVIGMIMSTAAVEAAELVATRITAENAAQYVQAGPDAAGGIGDWILSNGSVCAVISGIAHESELSVRGGTLIDLGYCGRADDHYVGAQDLIDSSRDTPVNIERVDAKVGPDSAVIRSFGRQGGVIVETSYRLDANEPDKLFITKHLTQRDGEPSVALYTSIFFNYYSLVPFVASTVDPSRSNGFVQESFVTRGPTEIATFARTADLIVALSPEDADAPITYGWQMVSAKRTNADGSVMDLPFYALADFSALSFLAMEQTLAFCSCLRCHLRSLRPVMRLASRKYCILRQGLMWLGEQTVSMALLRRLRGESQKEVRLFMWT